MGEQLTSIFVPLTQLPTEYQNLAQILSNLVLPEEKGKHVTFPASVKQRETQTNTEEVCVCLIDIPACAKVS